MAGSSENISLGDAGTAEAAPDALAAVHRRERILGVDRAKGIGIFLVVFGHVFLADGAPTWYIIPKAMIYQFHMPFFMYLSGWVFFYTQSQKVDSADYREFVGKRAYRLLIPFFAFGLITIIGKYYASLYVHVDDAPTSLGEGLKLLFIHTNSSPALSIWYIFCLFVYSAVAPKLWNATGGKIKLILIASVLIALIPFPDIAYLDRVVLYAPFFFAGGAAQLYWPHVKAFYYRYFALLASLFVLLLPIMFWTGRGVPTLAFYGTLSLPVLHELADRLEGASAEVWLWLGRHCFVIYLLNTILIGVGKVALNKLHVLHVAAWAPACAVLTLFAIAGSVMFKEWFAKRIPPLYEILR